MSLYFKYSSLYIMIPREQIHLTRGTLWRQSACQYIPCTSEPFRIVFVLVKSAYKDYRDNLSPEIVA